MAVKGLGISGEFEGQALCALNMKSGYQQWGGGGGKFCIAAVWTTGESDKK